MRRGWKILIGVVAAFAPGYDVPDAFVEDVKRMTYSSYTGSHEAFDDYTGDETAALVLAFDKAGRQAKKRAAKHELQKRVQKREAVRKRP